MVQNNEVVIKTNASKHNSEIGKSPKPVSNNVLNIYILRFLSSLQSILFEAFTVKIAKVTNNYFL